MGSVDYNIKCPKCGNEKATEECWYRSGQYIRSCGRCGYYRLHTLDEYSVHFVDYQTGGYGFFVYIEDNTPEILNVIRKNEGDNFENISERKDVTVICDSYIQNEIVIYKVGSEDWLEKYIRSVGGYGALALPPDMENNTQKYLIKI